MILSILLILLSAPLYGYCALHDQGKLKGWGPDEGFFGFNQYRRKWAKNQPFENSHLYLKISPNTWYYRFFKLKYKERFPGSAMALSFLTDGYHLFQMCWKILVFASVSLLTPNPLTVFFSLYAAFSFVYMWVYKWLE